MRSRARCPIPIHRTTHQWTVAAATVAVPKCPARLKSWTSAHPLTQPARLTSPRKARLYAGISSLPRPSSSTANFPADFREERDSVFPRIISLGSRGFCWHLLHLLIRSLPPLTPDPRRWIQGPSRPVQGPSPPPSCCKVSEVTPTEHENLLSNGALCPSAQQIRGPRTSAPCGPVLSLHCPQGVTPPGSGAAHGHTCRCDKGGTDQCSSQSPIASISKFSK